MARRKRNTGGRGPHVFPWQVRIVTDRSVVSAYSEAGPEEAARAVQNAIDRKYFQGETMTCILCGKQDQSDPEGETGWRLLEADGVPYYVCPAEFPPDDADSEAFAAAYMTVLAKIGQMREAGEQHG